MRDLSKDFENKNIDYKKVKKYGFVEKENSYFYEQNIIIIILKWL